jgi:hypothetical protein
MGLPKCARYGNGAATSEQNSQATRMQPDSPLLVKRKSHGRSRVSNGRDILPDVDGRSVIARRYRHVVGAILTDQGGEDRCSESRKQLIRRFAAAAVLAEQLEGRLANGEQINIAEHATLSSTLVRLASRIGIDRMPRDVTPTLRQYLGARATETATSESDAPDPNETSADLEDLANELPNGVAAASSAGQ